MSKKNNSVNGSTGDDLMVDGCLVLVIIMVIIIFIGLVL